ncbi:hypothetical protein KKI24_29875 [bacterium]|nr:hypothetical protein [bacterium]
MFRWQAGQYRENIPGIQESAFQTSDNAVTLVSGGCLNKPSMSSVPDRHVEAAPG